MNRVYLAIVISHIAKVYYITVTVTTASGELLERILTSRVARVKF